MDMRSLELIIFDLDGTLLDSLEDIAMSANRALARFEMPTHPVDDYRHHVGDGLATLVRRIAPAHTSEPMLDELHKAFVQIYQQAWHDQTRPYPGIVEMLEKIQNKNSNMAVLSNKPDAFTKLCVAHFFPQIRFFEVSGQQDSIPKKPHPQGALAIAEHCGAAVQACVFVGDTAVDIHTARASGMHSIGVTWGFRGRTELEAAGADTIITNPDQLTSYVINTH